jgi:hypothetical protein
MTNIRELLRWLVLNPFGRLPIRYLVAATIRCCAATEALHSPSVADHPATDTARPPQVRRPPLPPLSHQATTSKHRRQPRQPRHRKQSTIAKQQPYLRSRSEPSTNEPRYNLNELNCIRHNQPDPDEERTTDETTNQFPLSNPTITLPLFNPEDSTFTITNKLGSKEGRIQ